MTQIFDIILHFDVYLAQFVATFGPWIYLLIFLIIFAETGLVVTPFLPGDSLLFAIGAICAISTDVLNVHLMALVMISAALIGDLTNYTVGKKLGPKIFKKHDSMFFSPVHLKKTQEFYEKYGSKTIIIARFAPIIRTFAPFVAGIGQMKFKRFISFSIIGALLWVISFLYAGFYFGNLPIVKANFHTVIFSVIGISLVPLFLERVKAHRQKRFEQAMKK